MDKSFYGWATSWTVSREVPNPATTSSTRAGLKRAVTEIVDAPPGGGANLVDVTLRVLVKNAAASMQAFRPEYQHGTTVTCGTINRGFANNFDEQPAQALLRLKDEGLLSRITDRGHGTGHNNDVDF